MYIDYTFCISILDFTELLQESPVYDSSPANNSTPPTGKQLMLIIYVTTNYQWNRIYVYTEHGTPIDINASGKVLAVESLEEILKKENERLRKEIERLNERIDELVKENKESKEATEKKIVIVRCFFLSQLINYVLFY